MVKFRAKSFDEAYFSRQKNDMKRCPDHSLTSISPAFVDGLGEGPFLIRKTIAIQTSGAGCVEEEVVYDTVSMRGKVGNGVLPLSVSICCDAAC